MSIPQPPESAKLVVSLFLKEKDIVVDVAKDLSDKLGPVDMVSSWLPFDYTKYYETEMGSPLFRRIFAFKNLIKQSALAKIKLATNNIEHKYSKKGKRMVNLDPGYMIKSKFVLATGKNYSHRIYIGKGIYADLTLIYTKGLFQKLAWTYPDYSDKIMLNHLNLIRNKYLRDL
ncbi:MAG TPA: DUF4416 family protein [Anaerolineae bacterium]|nr:DUF4416 family protein [Anaerolineae bacterium]